MSDLIPDLAVRAVFDGFAPSLRPALLQLRGRILAAAAQTSTVGELTETLKWGEPAYLPRMPRVGTTVRINALKGSTSQYAAYFHCQTTLIDGFRDRYGDLFTYDGNRGLIFSINEPLPESAFEHCVAMALTYHTVRRRVEKQPA